MSEDCEQLLRFVSEYLNADEFEGLKEHIEEELGISNDIEDED